MTEIFTKRSGTTDKGKDYENLIVAKFIIKLIKDNNIKNFKISSNDGKFGAFDDVVLEITESRGTNTKKWALQVKHVNEGKTLALASLQAKTGNSSIIKYFKSFLEHRESFSDCDILLMTTLKLNAATKIIEIEDDGEKFQVEIFQTQAVSLLNTSKNATHCHKFRIVKSSALCPFSSRLKEYEDFFEIFYLYSDQVHVDDLRKDVSNKFQEMFACDDSISDKCIKFINDWSLREGKKEKLDKILMQKIIALHLLSSHIHSYSVNTINERAKLLQKAVASVTITVFHTASLEKVRKIWGDAGDQLAKMDIKEINRIRRLYQPNSDYVSDLNQLSDEDSTKILWFDNEYHPLIVSDSCLVYEAVKLCPNRKYVLIGDNMCLEASIDHPVFRKLCDLTSHPDIFKELSTKFECRLPGNVVSLDNLIQKSAELQDITTTSELLEMVDEPHVIIDEKEEELPIPYINRMLAVNIFDFKFLESVKNDTFVVLSNVPEETPLKKYEKNENFHISRDKMSWKEFRAKCDQTKSKSNHLHLRMSNNQLHLVSKSGSDLDLEQHRIPNSSVQETELFNPNCQSNVNLITDEPGMGKSVFMMSLKNSLSSKMWTIIFSPNDISEICRFVQKCSQQNQIENFILDLKCPHYRIFQKSILRLLIKEGQVAFLWDALDEISDDNLKIVADLINDFSKKVDTQWITSRRHLSTFLQNKFDLFGMRVTPFDDEQQTRYIQDRLDTVDSDSAKNITEIIKSNVAFTAHRDILGIPLQIFMLTELFLRNEDKYTGLISDKFFSLIDLYEHFVDEKFNFHYKTKIGVDSINDNLQRILQKYKEVRIENYQRATLRTLFDDRFLNVPCNNFITEIEDQGDDIGFIRKIGGEDKKPEFLHNSYAEYFAALYFADNCKDISDFSEILFDKRNTNIRFFFDNLLAKDSPAHLAVLYKNFESLMVYKDCLGDCKDLGGRSVLHLASSWGERCKLFEVEKIDNKTYKMNTHGMAYVYIKDLENNDKTILEYLLRKCGVDEVDDLFKLNCLSYAEKSDCLLNVLFIENNGKTGCLNTRSYNFIYNIILYAVQLGYGGVVDSLSEYARNYTLSDLMGQTFLHAASLTNCYKICELLIKSGMNINIADDSNNTPLHLAVDMGQFDIVEFLIRSGANINAVSQNNNNTPLLLALNKDRFEVAEFLITSGSDINVADRDGYTPLHLTLQHGPFDATTLRRESLINIYLPLRCGSYDIAELLIKSKANISAVTRYGETALHLAAKKGKYEIVELLIQSDADVNVADSSGLTPVHLASQGGHLRIVELLINHGATINDSDARGHTSLHTVSRMGYHQIAELLLRCEANVNAVDNFEYTPLHIASQYDFWFIAYYLIAFGANVNVADESGNTPLHLAAWKNNNHVAELLIKHQADVNVSNMAGETPLHFASACQFDELYKFACKDLAKTGTVFTPPYRGYCDIVKLLIKSEATINAPAKDGRTPLHYTVHLGHFEIAQLLIESGADSNVTDQEGNTPLHSASANERYQILELLLETGADVNVVNKKGEAPLHLASLKGYYDICKLLLKYDANLNVVTHEGHTPLHLASWKAHSKIVKLLVESGANVNAGDKVAETPLHKALGNRNLPLLLEKGPHEDIAEFLVRSKADVSAASKYGWTPLHLASRQGDFKIIKLLVEYGGNVNAVDHFGETPLHKALANQNLPLLLEKGPQDDIAEFLIRSKADIRAANRFGVTPLRLLHLRRIRKRALKSTTKVENVQEI